MFGTIETKARPIKLAYLVEPDSAEQVRNAIRLSSSLWGGMYFPILPLYKRVPTTWRDKPLKAPQAKNVILGYLEAFDPDILVQLSGSVPDFIAKAGLEIIRPEEIWRPLNDGSLSPKFGIGIFELLSDVFDKYFKYKRKYPVKVLMPKMRPRLSLFWTSLFGELEPAISSILEKRYTEPLEIRSVDFHPEQLAEVMANDVLFPRRITQWGLDPLRRSGFRRDARVYFLDATKIADIVDFWNLRALGGSVLPVPKQLQNNPQLHTLVIDFLKAHRRPWRHQPDVYDHASIIRSRSSTMDELQEYAKTLQFEREPGDKGSSGYFGLQHWYPRIWDEWGRDKDGAVPDDPFAQEETSTEVAETDKLTVQLKPIMPEFAFEHGYHGEPRCANEISFRLYGSNEYLAEVLPKSPGENLDRAISGFTSLRGDWRIGRNGLVRLVKYEHTETRNIPSAEDIVFAWLRDRGWEPSLSAPGLLAKQIHKKLEGHIGLLRNEKLLGLLEYMNGGRVKPDGTPVEDNEIGQERDLPVGEVKNRLAGSSTRRDLYEYLLTKGIFKLGLRVQCTHCLRRSWLALPNVRDSLACTRCLNSFPAVGNIDSATWSYKTTGPFSVPGYADGAYAVLLTLDMFSNHKMSTMHTTPVVSFAAQAPNKQNLEADFGMFWQESLYGETRNGIMFGECKTYGRFAKKDFDRMRHLAQNFPGAVLVFSTLRKSLTPEEISGIARIAKAGRKYWKADHPTNPVLILTGTELLNWEGPPYCWDEALRKKFDRSQGLIEFCNATQQIYLNLPSWHAEWQQKWEERRCRRMAEQTRPSTLPTSSNQD